MKALLAIAILLPGCSVVFDTEGHAGDAQAGVTDVFESDGSIDAGSQDGSTDAVVPDAGSQDATAAIDADLVDAALCDPFLEVGCYVHSSPLGGPSLGATGTGEIDTTCTDSSDCAPFMFCGVYDGSNYCLPLCDEDHECPDTSGGYDAPGKCIATNWQSFGFCEKWYWAVDAGL